MARIPLASTAGIKVIVVIVVIIVVVDVVISSRTADREVRPGVPPTAVIEM